MYNEEESEKLPNQRLIFDERLQKAKYVNFFISCLSGTSSNAHADETVRPCVSYFICYGKDIDEEEVFSLFHDSNFDPTIRKIGKQRKEENEKEAIFKELKTVLKVLKFQSTFVKKVGTTFLDNRIKNSQQSIFNCYCGTGINRLLLFYFTGSQ